MKKQLEKIYLANVLLYFSTYKDLYTFSLINSKCFDAIQILKHFPFGIYLPPYSSSLLETNDTIEKTKKLLQNIQTIQIPNVLYSNYQWNICIKSIYINQLLETEIVQQFYQNIIKMKVILSTVYTDIVNFTMFPKLQWLYINDISEENNCIFILDERKRYSMFKYKANVIDPNQLYQQLKQYHIDRIVIDITNKKIIDFYRSLLRSLPNVTLISKEVKDFYENSQHENESETFKSYCESIIYRNEIQQIQSENDQFIKQFNQLYYPSKVLWVEPSKTINQLTQIEYLSASIKEKHQIPTQLKTLVSLPHLLPIIPDGILLLSIETVKNVCFPTTLTQLKIQKSFYNVVCYEDELNNSQSEKNECCYNLYNLIHLKELTIENTPIQMSSLQPLRHLTSLCLLPKQMDNENYQNSIAFPMKLERLYCNDNYLPKHSNAKFLILQSDERTVSNKLIMYKFAETIQILSLQKSCYIFPSSLKRLIISGIENDIELFDLENEPSLEEIIIENCIDYKLFVKMPKDLKKLTISNSKKCYFVNKFKVNIVFISDSFVDVSRFEANELIQM